MPDERAVLCLFLLTCAPSVDMALTPDEVERIADLAHLSFSDDEKEQLASEMSRILDHIDTLNELDTAGVPPRAHGIDPETATRADDAEQRISRDDAFANAPDTDGEHFRVPRVIESNG